MQPLGEGLQSPAVVELKELERREELKRFVLLFCEVLCFPIMYSLKQFLPEITEKDCVSLPAKGELGTPCDLMMLSMAT
jgi:hypothetical protein